MNVAKKEKQIQLFTAYKRNFKIPKLGCMVYTDGKIVNIIRKKNNVKGYYVNEKVFSDQVDLLVTDLINIEDANYIIYVFYKADFLNEVSNLGWYHLISDVHVDLINQDNSLALKNLEKTLKIIKQKTFLREIGVLENSNSPVIYQGNNKVYTLSSSKY